MSASTKFVTSLTPTTLGTSISLLNEDETHTSVSQAYGPGAALEFVIPPSNNNITSIVAEFKLVLMTSDNQCLVETAYGGTVNMNPNAGCYGMFSTMILRRAFNTTTIEAVVQANRTFCTKGFSAHGAGSLTGTNAGNYCDPSLLQQSFVPSQMSGIASPFSAKISNYTSITPLCFSLPFSTLNTKGVALPLNTVGGITIQLTLAQPYDFLVSMYGEDWYDSTMLNLWSRNQTDKPLKISFAIIAPRLVYISETNLESPPSITLPTRAIDTVRVTANYGLNQNFGWALPNGIYRQIQVYLMNKRNIQNLQFGTNATLAFNTFDYKLLLNGIQQIWAYPTSAFPPGSQMSSFMPNEFVYWLGYSRDTVSLDRHIWAGALLSIPFDMSGNGIPINQTSINHLLTMKTRSVNGTYCFPYYPVQTEDGGMVWNESYTSQSTITKGPRFDLPVLCPLSLFSPFILGDITRYTLSGGVHSSYVPRVHAVVDPPYNKFTQYTTTSNDNELMIIAEKTQGIIIESAGNTIVPIAPVVRTLDKLLNFKLAPPISTVERTQLYQISGTINLATQGDPEITFLLPSSGVCNGSAFVTLRLKPRLSGDYPSVNGGYSLYRMTAPSYPDALTYNGNIGGNFEPIVLAPGKSAMSLNTLTTAIFNPAVQPQGIPGEWNANVDWYGTCSWSSRLKFGSIYSSARVQYPNNVTVRFNDYLEKTFLDSLSTPVQSLAPYYQFTRHPVQSLSHNTLNNSLFDDPYKLQSGGAYPKCMWLMPYYAGPDHPLRSSFDARCDVVVSLPLPQDVVALINNIPFSASTKIYLTLTIANSPDGLAFVSSGLGRGCITADPVGYLRGALPHIYGDFAHSLVPQNVLNGRTVRETDYYITIDPTYTPKLSMYLNYESPSVQGLLTKNALTEGIQKTVSQYLIQDARWVDGGIKEVRDEVNIAGRNPASVYYLTRKMLSLPTGRRSMSDKPSYGSETTDAFCVPHHIASTIGCGAYSVPISIMPYAQDFGKASDIVKNAGICLTPIDATVDGSLCFPTALNSDAMNALCFLLSEGQPLLNFSQNVSFPNTRHTSLSFKAIAGFFGPFVMTNGQDTYPKCWYSSFSPNGVPETSCRIPPTFSQTQGLCCLSTDLPFIVPLLPSSRNGSILKLRFNGVTDANALNFNWFLGTRQDGSYIQPLREKMARELRTNAGLQDEAILEIDNRNPIVASKFDWEYGLTSICTPYTQTLNFNEVSATLTTNFPAGYDI